MIYPILNQGNNIPPTLYSVMQSLVNYDKTEDKTKIKDLWSTARTNIFDFNYPLTSNVDKADFEHNILNHYLMRRINYDTVTLFKIMLENKLNEVMPKYNMLWDSLIDWNIFKAGTTIRQYSDSTTGSTISNTTTSGKTDNNSTSNTTTSGKSSTDTTNNENISSENTITTSTSSSANSSLETSATTKKGTSDTPQNRISEVEDSIYLTEYTHGSDNTTSSGSSSDSGSSNEDRKNKETKTNTIDSDTTTTGNSDNNTTSNTTTSGKTDNNTTSKDDKIIKETVTKTADNTLELLIKYQTEYNNIWTLLYKDMDCLFYGLV